jgi:hypothetical protein
MPHSRAFVICAVLGASVDAWATSAALPPPLETIVCPATHIFIGRARPSTYMSRETCDRDSVAYFQKDYCTEADVEVVVEEYLRNVSKNAPPELTLTYLPLKTMSITSADPQSQKYIFFTVEDPGVATHLRFRLRTVGPIKATDPFIQKVRDVVPTCKD